MVNDMLQATYDGGKTWVDFHEIKTAKDQVGALKILLADKTGDYRLVVGKR
jgi:hypothetical protein